VLPRIGQVVQALDKLLMRVFDHLPVGTGIDFRFVSRHAEESANFCS